MADNVAITAGSGTSIATDDVGGVQFQKMKLDVGGDGLSVPVVGSLPVVDLDASNSATITVTDSAVAAPAGDGTFRSGTSTAGSYVAVKCPGGDSAWSVGITGLTSGFLYYEGSPDSTTGIDGNWININGRQTGVVNTVLSGSAITNGMYRGNTSGLTYFRVRAVGALSGTPLVRINVTSGSGAVFLNASIPAGTNQIGRVQLSTELSRSRVTVVFQNVAPATADTLLTLTKYINGVAGTPSTSIGVTSGKTFRITAIQFGVRAGAAAISFGTLTIRSNSTGATVIGSPSEIRLDSGVTTATANSSASVDIAIPEGMEFSGTQTIGASLIAQATTNIISVSFIGYEY